MSLTGFGRGVNNLRSCARESLALRSLGLHSYSGVYASCRWGRGTVKNYLQLLLNFPGSRALLPRVKGRAPMCILRGSPCGGLVNGVMHPQLNPRRDECVLV